MSSADLQKLVNGQDEEGCTLFAWTLSMQSTERGGNLTRRTHLVSTEFLFSKLEDREKIPSEDAWLMQHNP